MTKRENEKCESLMNEAIHKANDAMVAYKNYELLLTQNLELDAKVEQRKADQDYGYAEGIYQALAVLGFKHDGMNTLLDLLM